MKRVHYFATKLPALYEKIEELYGYEDEEDGIDLYPEYLKAIIDLCPYLQKYHDFCLSYTEDLLLYALMYRNISIQEGRNSIFDKEFFVDRKDHIIGYKNKVFQSTNCSIKENVVKLFYEGRSSFVNCAKIY